MVVDILNDRGAKLMHGLNSSVVTLREFLRKPTTHVDLCVCVKCTENFALLETVYKACKKRNGVFAWEPLDSGISTNDSLPLFDLMRSFDIVITNNRAMQHVFGMYAKESLVMYHPHTNFFSLNNLQVCTRLLSTIGVTHSEHNTPHSQFMFGLRSALKHTNITLTTVSAHLEVSVCVSDDGTRCDLRALSSSATKCDDRELLGSVESSREVGKDRRSPHLAAQR
jgi:hypothetical protein